MVESIQGGYRGMYGDGTIEACMIISMLTIMYLQLYGDYPQRIIRNWRQIRWDQYCGLFLIGVHGFVVASCAITILTLASI